MLLQLSRRVRSLISIASRRDRQSYTDVASRKLRCDIDSTAVRLKSPRYDHSTTYGTIVGLPVVGLCIKA